MLIYCCNWNVVYEASTLGAIMDNPEKCEGCAELEYALDVEKKKVERLLDVLFFIQDRYLNYGNGKLGCSSGIARVVHVTLNELGE